MLYEDFFPPFASLLIGDFVTCVLFGINCLLASRYFFNHLSDPWLIRLTVALTVLAAALQTAFECYSAYYSLVTYSGRTGPDHRPIWSHYVSAGLTAVVALLVQLFFAYRISKLGSTPRIFAFISGSIALCVGGLGIASIVLIAWPKPSPIQPLYAVLLAAYMSGSILCDFIISATQIWFLRRSKTGIRKTTQVLNRLMVLAVNQGILTCALVFLELLFWFTLPMSFAWLVIQDLVAQIYLGSLLASLNARESLRKILYVDANALTLSDVVFSRRSNTQLGPGTSIIVTTTDPFRTMEIGEIRLSNSPPKWDE